MSLLALIGILMLFGPVMIFFMEGGTSDAYDGDLVLWLMSKTPEQIFLIKGSMAAGVTLVTAALAQRVWMM